MRVDVRVEDATFLGHVLDAGILVVHDCVVPLARAAKGRCQARFWWQKPNDVSWSSYFGQIDRLIDCRFLLDGIGRQVAPCGVQPHAVLEADDVVGNVAHGLAMVGVIALPTALHLQV